MVFRNLVILAALAFFAHGAVVVTPLAVAPYASSYAAHITHHSVAAPLVTAPAEPLVAAPAAHLITAPVSAPVAPIVSTVVSQFAPPASVLLK